MKKISLKIIFITILAILIAGCASSPISGAFYTNTKHSGVGTGGIVDNKVKPLKEGISECESLLSLFAFGDCTVNTAMEDGNITKVHSINHEATDVYFFYSSYTTIVKGE